MRQWRHRYIKKTIILILIQRCLGLSPDPRQVRHPLCK
ncbi:protein of unknown function [Magnetospirillum sp. XM-1]|nr:protein of unknown function [Magnetospirillum sp. XM-1]